MTQQYRYSRLYQGRIEQWDERDVQYPDDARLERLLNRACPVCNRLAWQHGPRKCYPDDDAPLAAIEKAEGREP